MGQACRLALTHGSWHLSDLKLLLVQPTNRGVTGGLRGGGGQEIASRGVREAEHRAASSALLRPGITQHQSRSRLFIRVCPLARDEKKERDCLHPGAVGSTADELGGGVLAIPGEMIVWPRKSSCERTRDTF